MSQIRTMRSFIGAALLAIAASSSAQEIKQQLPVPVPQALGGTGASSLGSAATTATGGSTARTLADRFAVILNVKDFGAVGDGSTDDTAAIQNAVNSGLPVYFPRSSGCYVTDKITIASNNRTIFGDGAQLCMSPLSLNPMFDLGTSSNVEIYGLRLTGNRATQTSVSSGSNAISSSSGSSQIRIHDNYIDQWTKHGISLDGVTDANVSRNYVTGSYRGAGILISATTISTRVIVDSNTIYNVQLAGIHSFVGVNDFVVSNNLIDGTNQGIGSGAVADCITDYQPAPQGTNVTIANNTCRNSGNNGIHVGADNLVITGNDIYNATLYGILAAMGANSLPDVSTRCVVSNNTIHNTTRSDSTKLGISIRDCLYVTATGNVVDTSYDGIELYGFATTNGVQDAAISGNSFRNVAIGIWLKKHAANTVVTGNSVDAATIGVQIDNYSDGGGSSPSFYSLIQGNIFTGVTSDSVQEETGSDYTKVGCNFNGNGSAGTYTLVGSHSKLSCTIDPTSTTFSPDTLTLTNALGPTYGGTGQLTYTLGDTLYASAANTLSKLAGNTSATKNLLCQTGNGSVSAAPSWCTLVNGDLPSTLSSKTLDTSNTLTIFDSLFSLEDDGDATKILKFQLSGFTTGATRTLTPQNQSGTIALLNGGSAQNFSGVNTYTGTNSYNSLLTVGSTTPATGASGEIAYLKITATGTAPGANYCKEEWVCGTNAGSAKKIAYCGTSTTPVTVIDNVGSGVTGC